MHVADVHLLQGNTTFHKTQDISGILTNDENLLLVACLVDGFNRLLDGPVTHCCVAGSSHIHQTLTQLVACNFVVSDEDEVCADGATPLCSDLAVDETIVNSG